MCPYGDNWDNRACALIKASRSVRANGWGGLKAQMLPLAQGNALGRACSLIKVSRSVRAAFFMRGNAPWHCGCACVLRARGAWHFCAVGTKMPNVLIASCVTQGVALGYGQHLGFQPATIKTIAHIILYMYRCICKLILQNILVVVIDLI